MFSNRWTFCFLLSLKHAALVIIPQDPNCQQALGLENGKIEDNRFTFPTDKSHYPGKEPYKARLNGDSAYCTPIRRNAAWYDNIYFNIDLEDGFELTGIALQGAKDGNGPGEYMKLYTSFREHEEIYQFNGSKVLHLNAGLKGDNIEYIPLTMIFATKLKIQLIGSQKQHCLRMEIYGCSSTKYISYDECETKTKAFLSVDYNDMRLSATDSHKTGEDHYGAGLLVFSRPFAWCLMTLSVNKSPYKEWATIDLKGKYLIYGLQVRGYAARTDDSDKKRFIPSHFKFQYSLDGKTKSYIEGKRILSTATFIKKQTMNIPLIAQFVYLSMKTAISNLTCIKLELYGCKAVEYEETVLSTKNPDITTNTTFPVIAHVNRYHIYQGNQFAKHLNWVDSDYDGKKASRNELNDGVGCLIDQKITRNDNPFSKPCWLGWSRSFTPKPFIYIVLTQPTLVAGISLRMYVNKTIGALPIKRFNFEASSHKTLEYIGSLCSPEMYYNEEATVIDYNISLSGKKMQYININLEYAGEWILLRQIKFLKQKDIDEMVPNALLLSDVVNVKECFVPEPSIGNKETAWEVTVIVIIVLVMLLLVLVAFIIHHYRTSVHKKWAMRQGRAAIIVQDQHSHGENRGFITSDPQGNKSYTQVTYANDRKYKKIPNHHVDEDIYDPIGDNSFDSENNSDTLQMYADCEDIRAEVYSINSNTRPKSSSVTQVYSVPTTKTFSDQNARQYAEPATIQYQEPELKKAEKIIYQGCTIYDKIYKNPYQSTCLSSLYAEPSKLPQKRPIKDFPRQKLVFKEKIGVGQFGEVHIAEASGLDEIYGTLGHFNSWGLPDSSLVAVKLLKSTDKDIEKEFMKEVEVMATLTHENVVRLLGICYEEPKLMVVEYMQYGDLNQFLQTRTPELTLSRTSQLGPKVLLIEQLVYMAQQVSAGMKYLHSVSFIHRDLASRNCLVGPAYQVKISDFGMSRAVFNKQYYRVEGKAILPIRWMAPECIYYGKFNVETDIWSYGVTLWEVFSFARETPYVDMSDPQVIEVACEVLTNSKTFPYLPKPKCCPENIYELMLKCWSTKPKNRPAFSNLNDQLLQLHTSSEVSI